MGFGTKRLWVLKCGPFISTAWGEGLVAFVTDLRQEKVPVSGDSFLRIWLQQQTEPNLVVAAVQNERQPRNTATLRPENLMALDSERILREAVGAFG